MAQQKQSETAPVNGSTDVPTNNLNQEERELASRLKSAIDRNGKYSYRLDDMTAGFAAGRNIPSYDARESIEDIFSETYRCTPHEYLERRFNRINERMEQKRKQGNRRTA